MTEPLATGLVAAVLFLAGLVKGVVGLGLPTVTLALLTATLGIETAMAVMLLPSLVSNLQQAVVGGALAALLRRLWPFLLALTVGTLVASAAPAAVAAATLTAVLGGSIALYGAVGLVAPPWPPAGRWEKPLSPVMGLATGVLTGMTGSFVLPAVPYLQALGLPRDRLVQAMGLTFLVATLALAAGLGGRGLVPEHTALLSVIAVPPALLGMAVGRRIRGRLSERWFRRALLAALLVLGLWILADPAGL